MVSDVQGNAAHGKVLCHVDQLMNFFYSLQDVKISLERINEIHQMDDENGKEGLLTSIEDKNEAILVLS